MKKKSRFLTGLLSAVMALSLCAMPALAAGRHVEPTTTTTANPVWTQDTGSPLRFISTSGMVHATEPPRPAAKINDTQLPVGERWRKYADSESAGRCRLLTIYQVHDADWLSKLLLVRRQP